MSAWCCYGCDGPSKQTSQQRQELVKLVLEEAKAEYQERLSLVAIKYGLSVAQLQDILDGYKSEQHLAEFHLGEEMRLKQVLPLPNKRGETASETIDRLAHEHGVSPQVIASCILDVEMLNAIEQIEYRGD